MSRLYSIGELLIDFQSVGTGSLKSTEQFVKKAGGAPANVAAQAVRLGAQATYLTKVGDDGFGEFLIETLASTGIDVRFIRKDGEHSTSLAFVSFQANGEREFSFYRKNAADLALIPEEFENVVFEKGDILEFGSVALGSETARKTHRYLIDRAKRNGAIVAFDPNLRLNLWKEPKELQKVCEDFLPYADVVKIGADEITFLTGLGLEEAIAKTLREHDIRILLVTDGPNGAKLYANGLVYHCPGYKVKAVDTTGAGDSFFGAFLGMLLLKGIDQSTLANQENPYQEMLEFACKAGAYTTTKYGAIQAMGNQEEIERTVK